MQMTGFRISEHAFQQNVWVDIIAVGDMFVSFVRVGIFVCAMLAIGHRLWLSTCDTVLKRVGVLVMDDVGAPDKALLVLLDELVNGREIKNLVAIVIVKARDHLTERTLRQAERSGVVHHRSTAAGTHGYTC